MIKFTAEPRAEKLFVRLGNYNLMKKTIGKELRKTLYQAGENIKREIVYLLISPPKTGKLYPLRGALHQSSAPGQPPANRTGTLIQSIYHLVRSDTELEFGETEPYAKFLEDGTTKMKPRPHLVTAANNNQRNIEKLLDEAIDEALP